MARRLGMTAINVDAMDIAKTDMDRAYKSALRSAASLQHQLQLTIKAWGAGGDCAYQKEWDELLQISGRLRRRLQELQVAECLATFAMRTQDAARYMAMDTEMDIAKLDDWSGQFAPVDTAAQAKSSRQSHLRVSPARMPSITQDIEDLCGPARAPDLSAYDWNCGGGHPSWSHSTHMRSHKQG